MPHNKITSSTNPHIKRVVGLRESKNRKQFKLSVVEGVREITQAIKAQIPMEEIFFCSELLGQEGRQLIKNMKGEDLASYEVSKSVYGKICYGEREEGLLAVVKPPTVSFSDLKLQQKPLVVVIEGIEKPGNLGAILRTADAAGVDALIVSQGLTDIYNPNVIRSSLGTVFSVPVIISDNETTQKFLNKENLTICATGPFANTNYFDANLNIPLAIILGSEQKGLSNFWLKHAKVQVKIPMHGQGDSLNISTSAAVIIYEAIRQRKI